MQEGEIKVKVVFDGILELVAFDRKEFKKLQDVFRSKFPDLVTAMFHVTYQDEADTAYIEDDYEFVYSLSHF